MSYFMVDVEADGPCPGRYSMVSFGAILVKPGLDVTFHGTLKPISETFVAEALAVSGVTREQTLAFPEPRAVMEDFADLATWQVYACGAPAMVDAARRDFTEQCGLPADEFFADAFTSQADLAK